MYKNPPATRQMAFTDFNQSCGMQLNPENEWCILAGRIDWKAAEKKYSEMFPSKKGRPAIPLRVALGALIIQKRENLSDRNLLKKIVENPYYQFFLGFESFQKKIPFTAPSLVLFRKRMNEEFICEVNESMLKNIPPTSEHKKNIKSVEIKQVILDATCSPVNIRYPQDFSLLEEARVKTDLIIDDCHKQFPNEGHRPRTYRRVLRKEFLKVSMSKKRTEKKTRALIRKQLGAVERNIAFIDSYLAKGATLTSRQMKDLETIRKLYDQQDEMFHKHTHRVEDRIVSIEQPHIRPIVRGKANKRVEFGAKYDVSIDENGHARLEQHSFDAYNESQFLQDAVESYQKRTGHYPKKLLADKIYRTKSNRQYCEERGIKLAGRPTGRPSAKKGKEEQREEHRDDVARNEVERFFSRAKSTCGAALIKTKLPETTMTSIALSILVANLFGSKLDSFFVLYFIPSYEDNTEVNIIEFVS